MLFTLCVLHASVYYPKEDSPLQLKILYETQFTALFGQGGKRVCYVYLSGPGSNVIPIALIQVSIFHLVTYARGNPECHQVLVQGNAVNVIARVLQGNLIRGLA